MSLSSSTSIAHAIYPLGPLQDLFELLGLPKGLIVNPANRDEGIQKLQTEVAKRAERIATALQSLQSGIVFWGKPVLSDTERDSWRKQLIELKGFLEGLMPFNTVAKLKNFPHDNAAIASQQERFELVKAVDELVTLVRQLDPVTSYLGTAEAVLPADHAWLGGVKSAQGELLAKVASPKHRADLELPAMRSDSVSPSSRQDTKTRISNCTDALGSVRLPKRRKASFRRTLGSRSCESSPASR